MACECSQMDVHDYGPCGEDCGSLAQRNCCDTADDGRPKCDGACIGRHACPDWDYMVITDGDPEWECCTCARFGAKERSQADKMVEHFGLNSKTNPGMGD